MHLPYIYSILTNWYQSVLTWENDRAAQKRIEEKLETSDKEISGIQVELHKLLAIEENLSCLPKSIERLVIAGKTRTVAKCIK